MSSPSSGLDLAVLGAVAAGGAVGAAARYLVGLGVGELGGSAEVGTLIVNVVGCALIGVLMVRLSRRGARSRLVRPALGTGVLGGFTTFSAYAVDVDTLARSQSLWLALTYLLITPVLAMLAVWAGARLGRGLWPLAPQGSGQA